MIALLNWRAWAAVGLALALALSHGFAYKTGRAVIRSEWDRDIAERTQAALVAEQAARTKEKVLIANNTKVSAAYVKQKKANDLLAASLNDSLRELQATLDSGAVADPARPGGANGTGGLERELLGNCAKNLQDLAVSADRLEAKVVGLQAYINSVTK